MKDLPQTVTTQRQLHRQPTTSERQEAAMMDEAETETGVVESPLENLKLRCLARGVRGVLDFGRSIRRQDFADDHTLGRDEFVSALERTGLGMTDLKTVELFRALDAGGRGRVDVRDLMLAARAHLPASRLKVVREAFNHLDRSGGGVVSVADVRAGLSVESHPRYLVGDESRAEIVEKFVGVFRTAEGAWEGDLTEEEFINYYAGVSPTIEDDAYFDLMIRQTFKLEHATECLYHETATAKREGDLMNSSLTEVDGEAGALLKLRAHCLSKGVAGVLLLGRLLRAAVTNTDGKLGQEEFSHCLGSAVSDLGSAETQALFDEVKDEEELVGVSDFLAALRPPLSEDRHHVIVAAFKKLDRSGDGVITSDDFKKGLNMAHHPRYLVGDESRQEIVDKLVSRFDGPGWDGKITQDDFINFYAVESATIDNDGFFDLMMRQSFKL